MPKWEIQAGRGLVRDGAHICNLAWPKDVSDHERVYPINPVELDELARRVVALLNASEPGGKWDRFMGMVSNVLTDSQLDHAQCGTTIRNAFTPARALVSRDTKPAPSSPIGLMKHLRHAANMAINPPRIDNGDGTTSRMPTETAEAILQTARALQDACNHAGSKDRGMTYCGTCGAKIGPDSEAAVAFKAANE